MRNVVRGQKIEPAKLERARQLRKATTPEERLLWQRLRGASLNGLRFRRQQIIHGFIVDFYCHASGLVVEVDGPIHDQQVEYDTERDQVLMSHGLRVLRLTNGEVRRDLDGVIARIAAAASAAIQPGDTTADF